VLAAQHGSGVTKKKSTRKTVLSSRAKRRQEKSLDRAEAVMERMALKVEKSKGQAKTVHTRRKPWDEINKDIPANKAKKMKKSPGDGNGDENAFESLNWETDEEMEEKPEEALDSKLDDAVELANVAQHIAITEAEEEEIL
jgi:hypothetical protein